MPFLKLQELIFNTDHIITIEKMRYEYHIHITNYKDSDVYMIRSREQPYDYETISRWIDSLSNDRNYY